MITQVGIQKIFLLRFLVWVLLLFLHSFFIVHNLFMVLQLLLGSPNMFSNLFFLFCCVSFPSFLYVLFGGFNHYYWPAHFFIIIPSFFRVYSICCRVRFIIRSVWSICWYSFSSFSFFICGFTSVVWLVLLRSLFLLV